MNLPPVPIENSVTETEQRGLRARISQPWFHWLNEVRNAVLKVPIHGQGSPAGVVVADIGQLYIDDAGGAGTTLFVKEGASGTANNWRAV